MDAKIAVAVSGGIDSLVSAFLLKSQDIDIFGIHFTTGYECRDDEETDSMLENLREQLNIPIHRIDLNKPFQAAVIDYFTETYQAGKTPNPCMVCNPVIKFGHLFKEAHRLGASKLATGHYARTSCDKTGRYHLFRGSDRKKDQSYFLARLDQKRLSRATFPLGDLTKEQVRKIASENGLIPFTRSESQDICFIHDRRYDSFLRNQSGFEYRRGEITDISGKKLGRHNGLPNFTVGQRRGINCPGPAPYYVVRLDVPNNRLIVGFKSDLLSAACKTSDNNWMHKPPKDPVSVEVRVRYRHEAAPATLIPCSESSAEIRFETPQSAITPGQGAVYYQGEEIIGAGWIEQ